MAATMDSLMTEITALRSEMKALAKIVRKVRAHQEDPTGEKAKARSANNGFNRPQGVTEDLRKFLELAEGEKISRSEVTKRINQYIKAHELTHPENKRVLILDETLKNLLKPEDGVQITFLNIQKYLSPHYIKDEAVAPTGGEDVDAEKKVAKRPTARKPKA